MIDDLGGGEFDMLGLAELKRLISNEQCAISNVQCAMKATVGKMTNKKAIPEIRFKGFTEAWEQRKMVDLAEYSKGNGYSKGDLTDVGTPIILYGRLYTKYQFAINEVDTFAVPRKGAVYSQGNEVIVPASGETAEDIARASAVEKSGVLLGGDLNILSPFDFINPLFLALAISNGEPQNELAKKAQGKSVVHIHNSDIQEVTIAYPSRTEQDRIVSVFRNLDRLITLHQRKGEKLRNVKKSMLEKMFPKNGSNVPEIRFMGFTEAWEQRKLGELVEFYNGDRSSRYPNDTDMVSDGIPFINAGDLVSGRVKLDTANKITKEKYDELSGAKIQRGDIIYCLRGTLGKNAFVDNFDIGTVASSLVDIRPRRIVGKYLFQVLNSDIEYRQRTLNDEGAAQPNLSAKNLSLFDIPMPTEAEQTQIAEYFANLDRLITLHQRELEKLQNIKQAMLEKMFKQNNQ